MSEVEQEKLESLSGGELVYRISDPETMRFREEGGEPPVLEGRMMPYGEWTEVNSSIEGHFMERFAPGSLAKTLSERARHIRVLFEHGLDTVLGRQTIAEIDEMREEEDGAHYRAGLLEGLPPLLVAGLRRGLYGSSIRFAPVKWERVRSPQESEHNPDGLPEHTIREAHIREFSVVTFPQYAGATASVRSWTDEFAAKQLLGDPTRLLEMLKTTEPPHSEPEPDEASVESRRTQPVHDYLQPEEDSSWRL